VKPRYRCTYGVTKTRIENLDADFILSWRCHFHIFDRERLSSLPGNGSFALDHLFTALIRSQTYENLTVHITWPAVDIFLLDTVVGWERKVGWSG
jgi:hypothetical protein